MDDSMPDDYSSSHPPACAGLRGPVLYGALLDRLTSAVVDGHSTDWLLSALPTDVADWSAEKFLTKPSNVHIIEDRQPDGFPFNQCEVLDPQASRRRYTYARTPSVRLKPIDEPSTPQASTNPQPVRVPEPALSTNSRRTTEGTWGVDQVLPSSIDP